MPDLSSGELQQILAMTLQAQIRECIQSLYQQNEQAGASRLPKSQVDLLIHEVLTSCSDEVPGVSPGRVLQHLDWFAKNLEDSPKSFYSQISGYVVYAMGELGIKRK